MQKNRFLSSLTYSATQNVIQDGTKKCKSIGKTKAKSKILDLNIRIYIN